jgi:tetratricopeptide (TPR) repeat protein
MQVYVNLSLLYEQQNQFDNAIEWYRKALLIEPRSAKVCNSLARCLEATGELEEAEKEYRKGK